MCLEADCFSFSSLNSRNCLQLVLVTELVTRVPIRNKSAAAYRLLALTLVLRPFGNLCLAWGTKHFSQVLAINPFVYIRAMFNPFVALGIAMLILVTLLRMALLSLADLSFIVPLTATGYILSTLLGKFFLQEQITLSRWAGILLIFAGTIIVSSTSQRTAARVELVE